VKKYIVELTVEQREELFRMTSTGKSVDPRADACPHLVAHPTRDLTDRAGAIPKSPKRWKAARQRWHVCANAVLRWESRRPFCPPRLNGCAAVAWMEARRAYLIALACSAPPDGSVRLPVADAGEPTGRTGLRGNDQPRNRPARAVGERR
jgi:hypothetical protein